MRTMNSRAGFILCGAMAALTLGVVAPARAETHALIMTISQYQGGVPPLAGVQYDAKSAAAIARKMGVPEKNITTLRDQQLTLAGMRRAFDELTNRIQPNDQVFIYYSGHGSRTLVREQGAERCAESLVSVDADFLTDTELEQRLKKISQKADKVITLFDACHSGGVTTRAAPGKSPAFSPKYWAKGGIEACSKPVNRLTRGLNANAKVAGSGAQNYVYIAAARDNEISLDQPGKGGVATQAWRDCITGAARDLNGSGGLSADEIRQCAQAKINYALKDAEGYLPHNVSIAGNPNAILAFSAAVPDAALPPPSPGSSAPAKPPVAEPVPPAVTPPAPAVTLPAPAVPAVPAPVVVAGAPPVAASPHATLADIYYRRDDRRRVDVALAKPALKINRDKFEFTLTSSHPGYVYLLMVGSDGKTFDMLFPNRLDKNNYVQAGQAVKLPRTDWEVVAQGPAGKDQLLVLVADAPREFGDVGLKPAGPFSMIEASPASAKDIQLVSGTSTFANNAECTQETRKRTLAVQKKCSNAYGASLVTVEEVE
ncbi:MAG: DUF4384 domain-containing protein [Gammaproteobacteria bacterium]|nr:MAG: DUF4384 domain-containing protein [Gammaproteobacteria bacterium]